MAEQREQLVSEVCERLSENLKPEQRKALNYLLNGKDVLVVLPTGFGKSLIFQLFAVAGQVEMVKTVALVICQLQSIVDDQIAEARSLGISAVFLSELTGDEMKDAQHDLIFTSAAEKATDKRFLNVLKERSTQLYQYLSLVVVKSKNKHKHYCLAPRNPR